MKEKALKINSTSYNNLNIFQMEKAKTVKEENVDEIYMCALKSFSI